VKYGEYDVMAGAEDRLWWYRGLRHLVISNLERFLPEISKPLVADVGCGTGGTYAAIRDRFPGVRYVGIDIEPRALEHCRARDLRAVVRGSADQLPLRSASVDALICLDVLYYSSIDRDSALRQFFAALKPGGVLLLNLPAFEALKGRHDLAVGIERRFRLREVRTLCEEAGFDSLRTTYWNAALFLPLMIWRRLSRGAAGKQIVSDTAWSPWWLNGILSTLILAEVSLTRWVRYPAGSSVLAVARKVS
jgi:SAM-dependent methyltransferase